jgi:hypothetical protein
LIVVGALLVLMMIALPLATLWNSPAGSTDTRIPEAPPSFETPGLAQSDAERVPALAIANEVQATVAPPIVVVVDGVLIGWAGGRPESKCRVIAQQISRGVDGRSRHGKVEVAADGNGRFQLPLQPGWEIGSLVKTRVVDTQDGVAFEGLVALLPSMTIRLCPRTTMRGCVVHAKTRAPVPGARVALRHATKWSIHWDNTFTTSEATDKDGRFELVKYFPSEMFPQAYSADIAIGEDAFCRCVVNHEDLVSLEGAQLLVDVEPLRVQVVDAKGVPVVGATVRCSSVGWGEGNTEWLARTTDGIGMATFGLPSATAVSLAVQAKGMRFLKRDLDVGDARSVILTTEPIGRGITIRGRVSAQDGSALSDAYLSAWPITSLPEVGTIGMVHAKSGPDGHYEIQLEESAFPYGLMSTIPAHGPSDEVRILRAEDQVVDLWHRDRRNVILDVRGEDLVYPHSPGPIRVSVASETGTDRQTYALSTVPFKLQGVPLGSYRVEVCLPGGHATGSVSLQVSKASDDLVVPVLLHATMPVAGVLVDEEGNAVVGARVRLPQERGGAPWQECDSDGAGAFLVVPSSFGVAPMLEVTLVGRVRFNERVEHVQSLRLTIAR